MELKVGDIVEFKKYEDLSIDETVSVPEDVFPKYGKVAAVTVDNENVLYFSIECSQYGFSVKSVARVIDLKPGDEVLAKVTIKNVFNTFLQIEPSVDKTDVIDVLKRKEPEQFIVREYCYNMYIGAARELVSDKGKAKIYTSRYTANSDAADMHLNSYDVITYDN